MRFRTSKEIRRHLTSQCNSGLSITAYCKREGIAQNTFFNWRKRHHNTETPPIPFFQLPVQSAELQKFDLTLPNGSKLSVPLSCDADFLRRTIRMMSRLRPR